MVSNKGAKELEFAKEHFFKFVFVRNPLERLYSCYHDKAVVNPHPSLKSFRQVIKKAARKLKKRQDEANEVHDDGKPPTFEEFLIYILHSNMAGRMTS